MTPLLYISLIPIRYIYRKHAYISPLFSATYECPAAIPDDLTSRRFGRLSAVAVVCRRCARSLCRGSISKHDTQLRHRPALLGRLVPVPLRGAHFNAC